MTDGTGAAQKSNQIGHFPPPRWMTRAEKANFRRLLDARNAIGRPVSATEMDLLADYVSLRSRIAALRRLFKEEFADVGSIIAHQRHVAGLARQIDASTSLSRKLAADLHLNDSATEGTEK